MAVQVLSRGGILGISLVTTILLTRHLGPAAYGNVTVCLVVIQLIAPLADPGISVTLATEGAAEPAALPGLVRAANTIARRISLPLVAVAAAGTVTVSAGTGATGGVIIGAAVSSLALLASARQAAITGALQAGQRFGPNSLGDVLGKVAYLLGIVVIVDLGLGAGFVLASTLLPPLVLLVATRRAARVASLASLPVQVVDAPHLFRRALPLGLSVLLFSVYFRLDTLILAWLAGSADVGQYGAAYRIAETLLVLPNFLTGALLPVLSRIRETDASRAAHVGGAAAELLGGLGLGVAVTGPFLARPLLTLLAGPAFGAGSHALALLLVSVGASFLTALWGTLLIVERRAHYLFRFSCVNVAINLAVNLALIPRFGPVGAASATLITEFMALLIVGHRLHSDGLLVLPWARWGRSTCAACPLALFLTATPHLEVILRGGVAIIVYLIAAVALRAVELPNGPRSGLLDAPRLARRLTS